MRFLTFLFLTFALVACANATTRITTFKSLMDDLRAGANVRIVIDYGLCDLMVDGNKEESPKAIGGAEFDAWEFFDRGVVRNDKAYVATSHSVMVDLGKRGRVINYVKIRVYEDGAVQIDAKYLKHDTLEATMEETFMGKLSSGKDKNAISLFKS